MRTFKPQILPAVVTSAIAIPAFLLYAGPLIGGIISIVILIYFLLRLLNEAYEITDDGVLIRSGIIAKSRATFLYSKIQDVSEKQGLLERIFGIRTVEVKTMSEGSGTLRYLSKSDAEEVKSLLLSKQRKTTETTDDQFQPYELNPIQPAIVAALFFSAIVVIIMISIPFFYPIRIDPLNIIIGIALTMSFAFMIFFAFLIHAIVVKFGLKYSLSKNYFEETFTFMMRSQIRLPFGKIQDIIMEENLFNRAVGLADVKLETGEKMAYKESDFMMRIVPSLKKDEAKKLVDELLKKSGITKTKANDMRTAYPQQSIKIIKETLRFSLGLTLLLSISYLTLHLINIFFTEIWLTAAIKNFPLIATIILILAALLTLLYEAAYLNSYQYSENEEILILQNGVINLKTLILPYHKIENIFIDQDLFDNLFGLWDVHVSTAGTTQEHIHIDGLKPKDAESVRNLFIKRTIYGKKTI